MKKKAFLMNGKRLLSFVLAVLMVCTLIPATDVTKVYAAEGDTSTEPVIQGNGTKDDPYQIGTADQLYWFAALLDGRDGITQNLNANAVLIADITVNEGVLDADGNLASDTSGFVTWTPPCKDAGRSDKAYQGTFDGKGHTILGLYAPDTTAKCAFIGSCDGTIRNLGITDSFFGSSKTRQTGTFVGYGYPKCVIENCFSTSVVEGDEECGGIAAKNTGTTKGCYFAGKISVNNYYSDAITTYGTKENCYYLDTCGFKSVNSENDDRAKTAEQFASGEVCYLLNNGVTDGTQAWYQMIDNENPDAFPKYEGLTIGYDEANQRYFGYCSGEHVWVKEKDIDPTCTEGGYIVYKCSKCGGTKTEPDNGKPALGHSCTEDGRCTRCGSFQALQPKNGDGTAEDPYQLVNYSNLVWFGQQVDSGALYINAILAADITANENLLDADGNVKGTPEYTWTPICNKSEFYQGTFDGKGHTISGLYAPDTSESKKCGFIGLCNGTIKNLGITDSFFGGSGIFVGTFVGNGSGECVIENCFSSAVVQADYLCGGIAGMTYGTIRNCYFAGKISVEDTSHNNENAIANDNNNHGTLENCYYLDTCGLTSERAKAKTAEQFASGEVCYLLNNGVTDGTQAWFQTINIEGGDDFPKFHGLTVGYDEKKTPKYFNYCSGEHTWNSEPVSVIAPTCTDCGYNVYKCSKCGAKKTESNGEKALGHNCSDDGICIRCGSFQGVQPKNGDGTKENPYQLANYSNLVWFGQQVDKGYNRINAILTADITANENLLDAEGNVTGTPAYIWTPICKAANSRTIYRGTFDGNGHTISGLYVPELSSLDDCGFFGRCGGTIKNLGITDSLFEKSISLNDCATGTFVGHGDSLCIIENCFSFSAIKGSKSSGGIAGITSGTIRNCYFAGIFLRNGDAIASEYDNYGTLKNCYYLDTCGMTSERAVSKTAEQFASGEVAFLLQDGQTDTVWGQNLAEGESRQNYPVPDGKFRVYYNEIYTGCEGKPGDVTYAYSNDDLSHVYAEHTDADNDGRCDICSNFMDGIGAGLAGYSLILDGSVGVNFYMELSDAVLADDTAYMEFTLPSGEVSKVPLDKNNSEVISDKTYYKFKCQVNAAGMTDTIKAQLKSNAGNSKVYEYTVKEYSDYLFANKENNVEFAKAYDLIKAMVNYGSYAQIYADYHTDRLAVGDKSDLTSVEDVTIGEEYKYTISGESVNANVTFAGASLTLLSTTTLRMYFKLTDVDADNVTFTYHGIDFDKTKSGDYYYVDIVGIPADKLDDDCEVRVTVDNNTTFEVTYNPMAYCYNVINRETTETRTDALKNLIKAMVIYNQAADAYVATIRR